jgi:hypothetical protein
MMEAVTTNLEYVRDLTDVSVDWYKTVPVENHTMLTIQNDDVFELSDIGKNIVFDANFSAYIVQLISDKQAVLSFRPKDKDLTPYQNTSCKVFAFAEEGEDAWLETVQEEV